jgi:L-iditol 2-dehydrogenase
MEWSNSLQKMSAIIWDGSPYPQGLMWCEVKKPEPPPGWVLIRNQAAGICGSDLHYLSGAMVHQVPTRNFPAVLGHENAGEVVEVGQGVSEWKVGDRVAAEPIHPCRTLGQNLCPACIAGQYHLCEHLSFVGIPANHLLSGGYGEFSLYHASCLFPLPPHILFEEAALLDILACGVHAANIGQPSPKDIVVILGCGPIGLCTLQTLKAIGVRDIIAISKYQFQAEAARLLGASATFCLEETPDAIIKLHTLIDAADQVYECVGGSADTIQQGIEICRRGGKIIVLGFFTAFRSINLETLFLNELSILCADAYSMYSMQREFDIALSLLTNGQVNLNSMITHKYPRKAWQQALDTAFHRETYHSSKVIFNE